MTKTFQLEHLDCAVCAKKMELAIGKIPGVASAQIDFMSQKLQISAKSRDLDRIMEDAQRVCQNIEPNCRIVNENTGEKKESKGSLWQIGISALLFLFAFLLPAEKGQLICFLAAYLVVGWEILSRAAKNIFRGQIFDENFLMALATLGALLLKEQAEAVAVMLFYQIGEWFQDYAVGKSRKSIAALLDLKPDVAYLETEGEPVSVNPDTVSEGDVILVRPGERLPLDGVVLRGSSSLDTAALTGESLPRAVSVGDEVLSGCINLSGPLSVRVTKPLAESTVAKILELVENAGSKKARVENFITRFAQYYTPFVVIAACLLAILPPLATGAPFIDWLHRALVFLVMSCPCALVLSVPLSFFGGIGGASRKGILIKGSSFLEALSRVETMVFDKTGTLTEGSFTLTEILSDNTDTNKLLEIVALAESYSHHPIAASICEAYEGKIDQGRISSVQELAGKGVIATVDGKTVIAGNEKLMAEQRIPYQKTDRIGTVVYVALDGNFAGCFIISDRIKPEAENALSDLKALGIKETVMLTGDTPSAAKSVADCLRIDRVFAGLLPADKVSRIEALLDRSGARTLAFVGDGMNDAPVLSRVDIGIAMGAMGQDAAIEAADIVLMDDDLSHLPLAVKIAKKTMGIVRQNIVFALAVKALVLLLGALGYASMWLAVFADVGVSVLAIINAMRTLSVKTLKKI